MLKKINYSNILLRVGMSLVFFWFGIKQIINPKQFAYYVPDYLAKIFGSSENVSFINGIFEVVFALFLIIGLFTKISSFILAIHLASITFLVGIFTPTGIRDFGLTIATFSIALNGPDKYCLDNYIKKKYKLKFI
jgi:uncharacterized membrane protein YphA (DoxX/SURF4 family)